MTELTNRILTYFKKLNTYPRPSDYEERVSEYLLSFGKDHGFQCAKDTGIDETGKHPVNNVAIYKPAQNTANQSPVILQAHMDMVPAADEAHSNYDFQTRPVHPHIEGNLMTGRGSDLINGVWTENADIHTTLGADDGIGVAVILALLDDKEITHPPLIAIFTTGEEIGMIGANHLTVDFIKTVAPDLTNVSLINVDEEQDGRFCYGCAGGVGLDFYKCYHREPSFNPEGYRTYTLTINGLLGGHSGIDIGKERANANCLLGHMLQNLTTAFVLFDLTGGSAENAIAASAAATIGIKQELLTSLENELEQCWTAVKEKYPVETEMQHTLKESKAPDFAPICSKDQKAILQMIEEMPNEAQSFMTIIPTTSGMEPYEVPETSSNLGEIGITWDKAKNEGNITFISSARSFYDDKEDELIAQMQKLSDTYGFELQCHDRYSPWVQKDGSLLKELFESTYEELTKKSPEGRFIHAGLECGVFAGILGKDTDMIACGPTIHDVHTPKETLYLETVPNIFQLIAEVLKKLSL